MPKSANPRPPPPELTDQEVLALLHVVRRKSPRDWPIFRLVIEHGFRVGEIVGNKRGGSRLLGMQIEDLSNDSIYIRRAHKKENSWERIGTDLMRRLKELAEQRRAGKLFETEYDDPVGTILHRLKKYAKEARITKSFNSEDLRGRLTELQVSLAIFEPEIAAEAHRMILFFALNYGLERSIRKLVFETLKKKYQDNWWNRVPQPAQEKVEERQKEDRDSPKIVRSISPLDYTTFPELRTIIEANWEDFKDQFHHGREKDMSNILQDLGYGRTLIAHSCELPEEEKTRFELRFGDWFRMLSSEPTLQIEKSHPIP